jgi:hypothetical protein
LLTYLAQEGRGRYHFAATPDELPALTIQESEVLRSDSLQEDEEYQATVYAPHSMLRDLFSEIIVARRGPSPSLAGYLALTPKPMAEVALQIGPGDPLLGVWGYGLGRVAVWTSDAGQEWATDWLSWNKAGRFWGQVIGYTLPASDLGLLQLEADVEPGGVVTLIANSVTSTGQTVDIAPTEAILTSPGGQEIAVTLHQIAPGLYQQSVRLPTVGAYKLHVNQTRPAESDNDLSHNLEANIGFVIPYPLEYIRSANGVGESVLRTIAEQTGGNIFSLGQSPNLSTPPVANEPVESNPLEFWPYLLGVALLLWPAEIAWRRWSRLRIQ